VSGVADDDEVGAPFLGDADQLVGRMAGHYDGVDGEVVFVGLGLDFAGQAAGVGGFDAAFFVDFADCGSEAGEVMLHYDGGHFGVLFGGYAYGGV
jgi:hypothetical protein